MASVRVAAVQDSPVLLDRAATLDRVDELTDRAAEEGARLIVFPEAFVPGPPVWIDALPVGDDAEWHALLMRESVTVPGPACDRLAAASLRAGAVLVVGVNEREERHASGTARVADLLGELHASRALSPRCARP